MSREWTYREIGTDFQPLHIDFGQPGGELFRPLRNGAIEFNLGGIDALTDKTAEAMAKQNSVAEARNFVDSLYQQHPTLRDVPISVDSELLPAESFDEFIQNQGLKSARPIDELPPDLSDVYSGKPSTNNGFNRGADLGDVTARPVAQSLDDVARASGALPRAARLLGNPATQGLIDVGVGLVQGDSLPLAATGAIGSTGGGFAGAYIGGALGAGIGSIIPVVGTAAGAGIGAFIGGWIGGQIGGDAFRGAFNALFPGVSAAQQAALNPTPGTLPFRGGQSPGVLYNLQVDFTYETRTVAPSTVGSYYAFPKNVPGPIRGLSILSGTNSEKLVVLCATHPTYAPSGYVQAYTLNGPLASSPYFKSYTITTIARADGQPDIGGNPLQINTTPITPTSRALSNPNNDRYNNYSPTGEPRSSARGDSDLFPKSGRLAPGLLAPIESGSQVASLPPDLPMKSKTPINSKPSTVPTYPDRPAETPIPPDNQQILSDPDYGWRRLIGSSTTSIPIFNRPSSLPVSDKSAGNNTQTGLRPEPPNTRGIGTGLIDEKESKCDCTSECDPCDLLQQIKNALLEEITLKLTYNACNAEQLEEYIVKAPRIHAIAQTLEAKDFYDDQRGHHACELSTAIPESWAWKVGEIPQLVVQFAEDVKPGKSSRWSVTIPHYRFGSNYQPNIPIYTRGNCMGTLILADNSQLVVNCKNKLEWEKFLVKITPLIDPSYLQNSRTKTTERGGQTIEQKRVKPVYGKFFSTGQKNLVPDWIIRF